MNIETTILEISYLVLFFLSIFTITYILLFLTIIYAHKKNKLNNRDIK